MGSFIVYYSSYVNFTTQSGSEKTGKGRERKCILSVGIHLAFDVQGKLINDMSCCFSVLYTIQYCTHRHCDDWILDLPTIEGQEKGYCAPPSLIIFCIIPFAQVT